MKLLYIYSHFSSDDAYGNEVMEIYEDKVDAVDKLKSDVCHYMQNSWEELTKKYECRDDWFAYDNGDSVEYWQVTCHEVLKSGVRAAKRYLESLIGLPDGDGGEILAEDIFKAIEALENSR